MRSSITTSSITQDTNIGHE